MLKTISQKGDFAAFCLGATHSGTGKTTITLALLRALKRRGLSLQPCKCGPDYIDPSFHARAAGCPSINLDTWMMTPQGVQRSFARACRFADVAVVEGVMGLFDGFSPTSLEGSSADCARLLGLPVILVVDAGGMAGSIAPLVKGFCEFNGEISIAGVIANNVGSDSHGQLLQEALAGADLPPLLGALPNKEEWQLEERHLGLVPFLENRKANGWFERLADGAERHIDIDRLLAIVRMPKPAASVVRTVQKAAVRLALARDRAFHFYYPDNLYLLRQAGFEIVEFSPLTDRELPVGTQLVMLGGGFPEVFAAELAGNESMRSAIKAFAGHGGMIYAECGGFMYLGESLENAVGDRFPMCGVVPGRSHMTPKLCSLGYREVATVSKTPFGPPGTTLRGHEFHWSEMELSQPRQPLYLQVDRTSTGKQCGIHDQNVMASYIHLHFGATPGVIDAWSRSFSA
ncbi:MAG: cobyrinate a,c-diamide synthase [Deltaproteobacteria bacterium]|nr:cobyrinate a,c-diamide synthase [Candidatus Anaeroferrophillus wilburensis]MBN2888713.1 cobyrinate a,c-diamide synthase [Deltaproteobacteria bacterium]